MMNCREAFYVLPNSTILLIFQFFVSIFSCFIAAENSFWKFFPNYLVTYLPLLAVMILNPVLYYLSSASIPIIVSQYLAQYTNKERHIVDMIKIKFGLINLTFYACWLPNIANAIIIFTSWNNFPEKVILALWYIMVSKNSYFYYSRIYLFFEIFARVVLYMLCP